jgi:ubiquinone/menaquinone biosynthesis C-methylase UbiE
MTSVSQQGQFWNRVTEQAQPIAEAQQLIASLIPPDLIQGRDVLDAGCGAGDYSAAFAAMGAHHINGFDVSVGSLHLARAQTPSNRFIQASLSELPYPANAFDAIWSWGVLHYVPNSQSAMHEIVRVLRPGGIAVIHTLRKGFWSSLELGIARIFSSSPRWVEPLVLGVGERVIPLITRLLTGRRPEEHTSKTVRQKLHERLFVPGNLQTFTFDQLAATLGSSVQVEEARPPVADLFKRDMSITVVVRKRS